jgi:hypothetical protein
VLKQTLSNIARRYSDDRVSRRIVRRGPPEDLDADHPFLQRIKVPRDRMVDDMAKELATSRASLEGVSFEDLPQVMLNPLDIFWDFYTVTERLGLDFVVAFHPLHTRC